jgi:hypothetical protein
MEEFQVLFDELVEMIAIQVNPIEVEVLEMFAGSVGRGAMNVHLAVTNLLLESLGDLFVLLVHNGLSGGPESTVSRCSVPLPFFVFPRINEMQPSGFNDTKDPLRERTLVYAYLGAY